MRLICPNCGAQYEVADDVIPEDGRDVQCSNCAHTWFETPGASALAEDIAMGGAPAADAQAGQSSATAEDPRIVDDIGEDDDIDAMTADDDDFEDDEPDTEFDMPPSRPDEGQRRSPLDGSVADILREEAAREEAARRAETAPTPEYQSDLGVDALPAAPGQRPSGADVRTARDTQNMPRPPKVTATPPPGRSQMFPDIEEINSTLRSTGDRGDATVDDGRDETEMRQSGFGRGFLTSLILVGLAVALYVFAADIAAAVPPLADPLASYTDQIDVMRIWLDMKLQDLLAANNA